MNTYFIKLTPLSPFFFGGERTFGDRRNQNYFAKSNFFPQQTTVLGMLRKELLIQGKLFKEKWNDYTNYDKNKMEEWIGTGSFKLDGPNNFGKIKSLSPVFLTDGHEHFIPRPFDSDFSFLQNTGKAFLYKKINFIPLVEGYNPKDGLSHSLISKNGTKKEMAELFEDFVKVGNAKERQEDDTDKFFKQKFYTLKEGFSFALFAEVDFDLKSGTVYMGADNSSFRMEAEKTEMKFENIIPFEPAENKISLLSDALVDENIYSLCQFAITETIDFRTTDVRPG